MEPNKPFKPLSKKQAVVYGFCCDYFTRNDQLPSAYVVSDYFGWASPNAAYSHLKALEEKGYIEKNESGRYRFRRVE